MTGTVFVMIAMIFLSYSTVTLQESNTEVQCAKEESSGRSFKLSLKGSKNSTGNWETDFFAQKEISNSSRKLNVDVEHKIFECNGKTVIHIKGFTTGRYTDHGKEMEKILFNKKSGKNAVIINNGLSAFRKNPDTESGHGILLTSRPMNENEMFEIRLESKISKWGGYSMGIGVTFVPIDTFTFPSWMMEVKSNTWMMYNEDIYMNGTKKLSKYGKNLASFQVGDRVGVMRKSNGKLHVFINGVDQGVAASDVPEAVHGVVDLIRDTISVTIV